MTLICRSGSNAGYIRMSVTRLIAPRRDEARLALASAQSAVVVVAVLTSIKKNMMEVIQGGKRERERRRVRRARRLRF